MLANLIALAVFLATFGALYGIYRLALSYRAAVERLQLKQVYGQTRARPAGIDAIGGANHVGDN